ncbi:MAG: threonine--tRNA ligase [Nitrospirae bacterium]|nr:MAG: threonine--tRNA ligase [Nitrospirota bacterium]
MYTVTIEGKQKEMGREELLKIAERPDVVALRVNGQLLDLSAAESLPDGAEVEVITIDSPEGLEVYRHSTAHVMAHAVKELFPQAKIAIGPAIENGFYYDFDIEGGFSEEDLQRIEEKMKEIIKANNPFKRKTMPKEEAIEFFKQRGEDYKVELLEEIEDGEVSLYEEGGFVDLCRGPHLPRTGRIKAFKLLSIAGAYWRGDEKNKMLQRIYGTAFKDKAALKEYLQFLEEVKKRDHRRLGKELDLFSIQEDIGPGLVLWHPNGAIVRKIIEDFWRDEHLKAGYQLLYTPHIAKLDLWQRSGHWDFYRENMYSPMEVEGVNYEIKPMNCPFHIAVYKSHIRSYRDLPLRYAELGTVYRFERSGVLHGLLRVRGFTQDDAHIFCTEDQIEEEVLRVLDFTLFILKTFGFDDYQVYLSTRPEKFVGTEENWQRATEALRMALEDRGLNYEIDPGEGVFYGPKIDIKVKDSLGRAWQCSTIQVDFNVPERFDVTYRGPDGKDHRPIMIHRALMGSLERFFGVLIEHYAGAFPTWLAPKQIALVSVAERHVDYATELARRLETEGFRVERMFDNEKVGYKVRQATVRKIPYSVIIGDREVETGKLSVRYRSGKQTGPYSEEELIERLRQEVLTKRNTFEV